MVPQPRSGLIFDPLVQTCIFDDSWPVQDARRRLRSAEFGSNRQECSVEIMEELQQLKATRAEDMNSLKTEMAELKAMLRALSTAKESSTP
jgi:hypothetical protein